MKKRRNQIWMTIAAAVVFVSAMACKSADAEESKAADLTKDQCAVTLKVTGMS